jgi:hypothetical protein
MEEIRRAAKYETHFFDAESLRFFDSRISHHGYRVKWSVFFVTSERFHGSDGTVYPLRYSVRSIDLNDWRVRTLPNHAAFQAYETGYKAHVAARAEAVRFKKAISDETR